MDRSIRIAVADDKPLFRRGFAMLLRDMADVQVIFECADGEALLTGLKGNTVDVVLMDLEMPVMDGYEARRYPRPAEHQGANADPRADRERAVGRSATVHGCGHGRFHSEAVQAGRAVGDDQ